MRAIGQRLVIVSHFVLFVANDNVEIAFPILSRRAGTLGEAIAEFSPLFNFGNPSRLKIISASVMLSLRLIARMSSSGSCRF